MPNVSEALDGPQTVDPFLNKTFRAIFDALFVSFPREF
jgi:hypothetical protein